MVKHGKKHRNALQLVSNLDLLSHKDAIAKVKSLSFAKFDESIDIDVNLGIDATKGDQVVRGGVVLPHGTGKKVRIVVFAKGDAATQAEKAGADFVGAEDLIEKISQGWVDFDFAVATPDMVAPIGVLARILGPKGLLPNKKLGTVTQNVGAIVADLKKGKAFFKNDKQGLVHFSIGKVSFDVSQLQENFVTFMKTLAASKPAASKGKFIRKVTMSSSMGVGIGVNLEQVS
ncbi:50S ribosomal protein L1 [Candidatus Chromulinivorax destructor]|uniref:Large ribosomal subunit protein uL1 n=1 Tax=Candidatus Chromulinivorax destructor TaxID=2066483 RepID=A0A345ZB37_9BACT|nr:50S ribosomal protein L1 [Candidatus Chromulinivorax destructor]AXK60504.1 50S ribosomal protein L1 [Candidatus Chromulinivorax destructor]